MAKRKYLIIASFISFIAMLLILYYYFEIEMAYGMIMHYFGGSPFNILWLLLSVYFIVALAISCWKNKPIFLHISTVLSTLLSLVLSIFLMLSTGIMTNYFLFILFSIGICSLYFLGNHFIKDTIKNDTLFHFFSVVLLSTLMGVYYGIAYMIVGLFFCLLAYFLYHLPKRNNTIGFHIIVGLSAITAILFAVLAGAAFIIFLAIFIVGYAIMYFIVCYTAFGRNLLAKISKFFSNDSTNKESKQSETTADYFSELEQLYQLYKEGVLTDEEFQTQKDKILGGK